MNHRPIKVTIATLIIFSQMSCNSKGTSSEKNDADNDSIVNTECQTPARVLTRMPDTTFESANLLKYQIEVRDTSISPLLSSLDDLYEETPGVFTFRKGIRRNADFGGKINGKPTGFDVLWTFMTGIKGNWGGGTGWTGQPLYVEWPDSIRNDFARRGTTNADKEIIVGSLDGSVYFIDYESGTASRNPIEVGNPIKGTVSLDPTLNGNLYVGHGVPDNEPFGAITVDVFSNKVSNVFPRDPKAQRSWGAYDSSALRVGQFVFRPGENGTIYKWYVGDVKPKLHSALRYTVNGTAPGIESSMAVYSNYGYTADNHGNILCFNLDNLKPVWVYRLGDDIDSSIVLIEEDGHPYIYTGCEIDRQGKGTGKYVKLDALTGQKQWLLEVPGVRREDGSKHFDGGFYSTALPGSANCDSLLFINCVLNTKGNNGQFMAINRNTGKVTYTTPLQYYSWSSPVGFVDETADTMYVVTGDGLGRLYLIDGASGKIIATKTIGFNFESSPVVVGDNLVVGSRGQSIFKVKVTTSPPAQ